MADNYSTFKHGGTLFPLPSAVTNGLLRDADPALFYALDFYTTVIRTHLTTRLAAEATAIGYASIDNAVAMAVPYHPLPFMTEEQLRFPLLAVYRKADTFNDRTMTWRLSTGEWGLDYILPPMNAAQAERLLPALNAVRVIVENRTDLGFDPSWNTSARVWGSSYANLEKIDLQASAIQLWQLGDGLPFHALACTLTVRERQMPVAGAFETLTRVDGDVALDDSPADENVAQVQTDTD